MNYICVCAHARVYMYLNSEDTKKYACNKKHVEFED